MTGMPPGSPESHPEFILRDKSRACKQWFRQCLETPNLDYDDWMEQKFAVFNWWISGLNADKSGPGSLDARLRLRPDVRDVLVDVLGGLESALCEFYQLVTSTPLLFAEKPAGIVAAGGQFPALDETRPPSPWSDMSDSSKGDSNNSTWGEKDDDQKPDNNASSGRDVHREQRVYIETNLETLIRIHTAIKRSGLKFRNQDADEALKRAEEYFQLEKAGLGEHQALRGQNGEHERFRRYLTKLVLWNGYTQNLVQRMGHKVDKLAETSTSRDKQSSEFLLQRKVLIVIRAYFYDTARLTTVQRRLINANVIRRNRLIYAGRATKASFGTQTEFQAQPRAKSMVQQVIPEDRVQPPPQFITPAQPKHVEIKAGKSFVAQPATALESTFSITGALAPPRATKSVATKMSARVGHLDYPKCPVKSGQFPCPYCPIILTEEYTEKDKWRGHVAQDLCAYTCIFEDCESSDEMFISTYEWMSHMARFHSETEWVCHRCTKHPTPSVRDASIFQTPKLLQEHLLASHPSLDLSEHDFLLDAGKQIAGIRKVRCPLCRPGLVTLEEDEENDDMTPPLSVGYEIGLIQLEEDEHIATHIHEFALYSVPFLEEASESSQALSHSFPSTRVKITFQSSRDLEASHTSHSSLYSLSDVTTMLDNLHSEAKDLSLKEGRGMQRFYDILGNLRDTSTARLKDLQESADIDAFAFALNESRATISQLRDAHADHDTEESLLDQLFDNLDRSNKSLQQALGEVEIIETAAMGRYHVPFQRNPRFIGRDAVLNNLYENFFGQKQSRKAALVGLRGVGKTEIALQFAYWVMGKQPDYSIFWIPMQKDEGPKQAYMKIAQQLGIQRTSDDEEVKELVCRHIFSDKACKYLLIMDGADDQELLYGYEQKSVIKEYLPESENCLILLTTRDKQVAVNFAESNTIQVGRMSHEEAIRLLEHSLKEKQILQDEAIVTELLSHLAYLPLAISQAAGYLNNTGLLIQGSQSRLKAGELYDNAVAAKWLVVFDHIKESDHAATDLLLFMSFIEPKAIPLSILPWFEKEEQERGIAILFEHSFLVWENRALLDMHNFVQIAAQQWIEMHGWKKQVINDAMRHIADIFLSEDAYSRPQSEHLPHVWRLLDRSIGYETKERYDLLLGAGRCLSTNQRFNQATICLEEVCEWRKINFREADPSRLESEYELAYAYLDSGRTEKAIRIFEHIVAVRRRTLPKGNHSRHESEFDLANAYLAHGQTSKAINLFEHIVAVYQMTLPTEDRSLLTSELGLANAYFASGQTQMAFVFFDLVVAICQRRLEEENHFRLISEQGFANVCLASGWIDKAISIFKHVVAVRQKMLPPGDYDRVISEEGLIKAYHASGNTEEADKILGDKVKGYYMINEDMRG